MTAVTSQRGFIWTCFAVVAATLVLACAPTATAPGDGGSGPATDATASTEAAVGRGRPTHDKRGVLVPQKAQALGVALPVGFRKVETSPGSFAYVGEWPPDEVLAFYHKYLECPFVVERRNGWTFENATPVAPGDTSRTVDLLIHKRSRNTTEVIVTDKTAARFNVVDEAAVADDQEAFETLRKAAHKGAGSVAHPIPGTY
jgi:hypothetical protein